MIFFLKKKSSRDVRNDCSSEEPEWWCDVNENEQKYEISIEKQKKTNGIADHMGFFIFPYACMWASTISKYFIIITEKKPYFEILNHCDPEEQTIEN